MTTYKVLRKDLSKRYFHLHGVDINGVLITKKKLKRKELPVFLSNMESCLIGMQVCGGAYYYARKCVEFRHESKWVTARFVKHYLKSNKIDFKYAEALQRPNIRLCYATHP
jgi:hypothetical protein